MLFFYISHNYIYFYKLSGLGICRSFLGNTMKLYYYFKRYTLIVLILIGFIILYSCNTIGDRDCNRCSSFKLKVNTLKKDQSQFKPIINVYMENSGSMFGYVNGSTEFEETIYSYLSDICLNVTDSMNLFYINSKIIPQQRNLTQTTRIKDFIRKLSPKHFVSQGGSLGITDISDIMANILKKTDAKTVSIFISDCIFSPGKGIDASKYLGEQQTSIKVAFANKIKTNKNLCVKAYRLNSLFKGKYYNKLDQPTIIDNIRPFYIILVGNENLISSIAQKVPEERIKGRGVEHSFAISKTEHNIDYEIVSNPKNGIFKRCMRNPKYHIVDAEKADKGRKQGRFMFTIGANFSNLPIKNDYLLDPRNYTLNSKDYELSISLPTQKEKFSHLLSLNLKGIVSKPGKCDLTLTLKKQLPLWINQCNDEDGLDILQGDALRQTYGLKHLFEGIYEAFINDGKSDFTEIKVFIN